MPRIKYRYLSLVFSLKVLTSSVQRQKGPSQGFVMDGSMVMSPPYAYAPILAAKVEQSVPSHSAQDPALLCECLQPVDSDSRLRSGGRSLADLLDFPQVERRSASRNQPFPFLRHHCVRECE